MEFDEKVLTNIIYVLEHLTTPDGGVQDAIYSQFKELQNEIPTFCFYLVYILTLNNVPINIKFSSIVILYRTHKYMPIELFPQFTEYSFPVLNEIIYQFNPSFTKFAIFIICSEMKILKNKNFDQKIIEITESLLLNEDTVKFGLNMIEEMYYNGFEIPKKFLEVLPNFLDIECIYSVLSIILKITKNNPEYGFNVLPLIYKLVNEMDTGTLIETGTISLHVYVQYENDEIEDFISYCLSCGNKVLCSSIVMEMSDLNIPFSKKIMVALLKRLAFKDDDELMQYNTCFQAQLILQNMCDIYGKEAENVVKDFLVLCIDPGHYLRCLYTCLSISEDSNLYYNFIIEHINDDYMDDAVVCLVSFCYASPSKINQVLEIVIPLIEVGNDYIIYALQELLQFDFEPSIQHFVLIFEKLKNTQTEKCIKYADLLNQYSYHFQVIKNNKILLSIFKEFLVFYFNEDPLNNILFSIYTETLSNLVLVVSISFDQIIIDILIRSLKLLDFVDDETLGSIFCLLKSIFKLYNNFIFNTNVFKEIILWLTSYVSEERENKLVVQNAFDCIFTIGDNSILLKDFGKIWVDCSLYYFSSTFIDLSGMVSKFWIKFIKNIDYETLIQFYNKSQIIMKIHNQETEPVHNIKLFSKSIENYLNTVT